MPCRGKGRKLPNSSSDGGRYQDCLDTRASPDTKAVWRRSRLLERKELSPRQRKTTQTGEALSRRGTEGPFPDSLCQRRSVLASGKHVQNRTKTRWADHVTSAVLAA